jgi:flap endonuclease-1
MPKSVAKPNWKRSSTAVWSKPKRKTVYMGIQDLNVFLKEKAPCAFRRVNMELFRGQRIAIDAPLLLFASFSASYCGVISRELTDQDLLSESPINEELRGKVIKQVIDRISSFSKDLFSRGITPIFVFDGTAVPEKTSGARARRKARRVAISEKVEALRQQILETVPIQRKQSDLETLRNLYRQQPPVQPLRDFIPVRAFISKSLGAPVLDAPDEAEKFCAYLASLGIAAASYSTDTDSYAFGAPLVITGIDEKTRLIALETAASNQVYLSSREAATHFSVVVVPLIFSSLKMNREQFVDLCISFGCDFNSRMAGYGPSKMWKLLSAAKQAYPMSHRLIEIAASSYPDLNWECLNAERCRQIFLSEEQCLQAFSNLNVQTHLYCSRAGLSKNVTFHV